MPDKEKPIRISIAAARTNAGLSQREMAETMGVSVSTITNWEKGVTSPNVPQLRVISQLSGVPMDYIYALE